MDYGSVHLFQTAPVIWSADAGVDGKAICLKSDRCIIGTNDGRGTWFTLNTRR